ncbi:MAG: hypothetical protein J0H68_00360 [Sphingobacteriia bacterium]|nr:hypothetical protein [Sphingobacteriia bacterium]
MSKVALTIDALERKIFEQQFYNSNDTQDLKRVTTDFFKCIIRNDLTDYEKHLIKEFIKRNKAKLFFFHNNNLSFLGFETLKPNIFYHQSNYAALFKMIEFLDEKDRKELVEATLKFYPNTFDAHSHKYYFEFKNLKTTHLFSDLIKLFQVNLSPEMLSLISNQLYNLYSGKTHREWPVKFFILIQKYNSSSSNSEDPSLYKNLIKDWEEYVEDLLKNGESVKSQYLSGQSDKRTLNEIIADSKDLIFYLQMKTALNKIKQGKIVDQSDIWVKKFTEFAELVNTFVAKNSDKTFEENINFGSNFNSLFGCVGSTNYDPNPILLNTFCSNENYRNFSLNEVIETYFNNPQNVDIKEDLNSTRSSVEGDKEAQEVKQRF